MKTRNTTPMTYRDMAEGPAHHSTASGRASAGSLHVLLRRGAVGGLALFLGACSSFGNSTFVDPAKYELFNCQQLKEARNASDIRVTELERLMAKAETGAAGSVVSGLAYQTDFVATKADRDAIDIALAKNNCSTAAPTAAPATPAPPPAPAKRRH